MDPAAICDYIQDHRHYLITSEDSLNRAENKHTRQILGEERLPVTNTGWKLEGGSSSEGGPDPLAGRELVAKVGPRGGHSSFVLPRAQGLCLADFRAHIVNYLQTDGVL